MIRGERNSEIGTEHLSLMRFDIAIIVVEPLFRQIVPDSTPMHLFSFFDRAHIRAIIHTSSNCFQLSQDSENLNKFIVRYETNSGTG